MAFSKYNKLVMIGVAAKYYIALDNFYLKQLLVLKIPPGMFFTQETQK